MKVVDLRTRQIDRFYRNLRDNRGLAHSSIRQIHAIRRALRQAVAWDIITANPAQAATVPKIPAHPLRIPSPEEVARILHATENPQHALALHLAAATSARAGELCALRWSHFNPTTGTLHIAQSLALGPNKTHVLKDTKTHTVRTLTLDPNTTQRLSTHRTTREDFCHTLAVRFDPDSFILSNDPTRQDPMPPGKLSKIFSRARKKASLENIRLHDLRHFGATQLLDAGIPVPSVAHRLSHTDGTTTLRVYAHATEKADQQAANVMGDLLPTTKSHPT